MYLSGQDYAHLCDDVTKPHQMHVRGTIAINVPGVCQYFCHVASCNFAIQTRLN